MFAVAAIAGAINSVAGGGTLLTFPALLAAGELSTIANATSTVAVYPGQFSSLFALRSEVKDGVRGSRNSVVALVAIGIAGGAGGAWLVTRTNPAVFNKIVPFLILLAVVLFLVQEPLARWRKAQTAADAAARDVARQPDVTQEPDDTLRLTVPVAAFLLGVAVYGGYFGAGIGILTLAALGFVGMRDIHRMNGVKAVYTLGVNGAAVVLFVWGHLVVWPVAGLMAVGSLVGGYAGAGIARRIGQVNVRRIVVAVGVLSAAKLLWDQFALGH